MYHFHTAEHHFVDGTWVDISLHRCECRVHCAFPHLCFLVEIMKYRVFQWSQTLAQNMTICATYSYTTRTKGGPIKNDVLGLYSVSVIVSEFLQKVGQRGAKQLGWWVGTEIQNVIFIDVMSHLPGKPHSWCSGCSHCGSCMKRSAEICDCRSKQAEFDD